MTATLARPTHSDIIKFYDVEGCGVISRDNAIFVHNCLDRHEVDSLAIDQSAFIRFKSGMGITTTKVTRIA